jgi:DNA polymerase (family X)
MNNSEIATILGDIADLLELKGENPFKARAYRTVARSIEGLPVEVEFLISQNRLDEIPGVGEAIAKKLVELTTTGRLEYYEKLKAEFPEGVNTLLNISGVGPRTASRFFRELGITSIDELEKAILDGRVAKMPRIGEKTADNILYQIQLMRKNPGFMTRANALRRT